MDIQESVLSNLVNSRNPKPRLPPKITMDMPASITLICRLLPEQILIFCRTDGQAACPVERVISWSQYFPLQFSFLFPSFFFFFSPLMVYFGSEYDEDGNAFPNISTSEIVSRSVIAHTSSDSNKCYGDRISSNFVVYVVGYSDMLHDGIFFICVIICCFIMRQGC